MCCGTDVPIRESRVDSGQLGIHTAGHATRIVTRRGMVLRLATFQMLLAEQSRMYVIFATHIHLILLCFILLLDLLFPFIQGVKKRAL
jgi:hypothetical protein